MKTFHNGSYAKCDVALRHRGMCSDINMMSGRRQARHSITMGRGWASRIQDPRAGHPGGKIEGRTARWPSPLTIACLRVVSLIFCFPETTLEKSDV